MHYRLFGAAPFRHTPASVIEVSRIDDSHLQQRLFISSSVRTKSRAECFAQSATI
jgi:hypothetical protein